MAQTDNITRYICDRCAKEEYLESGDRKRDSWQELTRYTADNVDAHRLLCADCMKEYKALVAKQDADFNSFMAGGR